MKERWFSFVLAASLAVLAIFSWSEAEAAADRYSQTEKQESDKEKAVVRRIEVTGNKSISGNQILAIFGLKPGDEIKTENVSEGIRRLVQTKNFADIEVRSREEGDSLVVTIYVEEYPRVKELKIAGFEKLKREDIEAKITLKEGMFARPSIISQDIAAIKALYAEKGYNQASIEVKKHILPREGSAVVAYVISEGRKTKVRYIDFLGNGALESKELKSAMETKESRWLRGNEFKPATLEEDLEKIKELYASHGYLEAEVEVERQEETSDGKYVDLYLRVREGQRYFLGDLSWTGNTIVTDDEIKAFMDISKGEPFAADRIEAMQYRINADYWEKGYIYSRVVPERRIRKNRIDLMLRIVEGNQASIKEIKISGNTKTFESVIRRELKTYPGDKFVLGKVQRSLREIVSLGYFNGAPKVNTEQADSQGNINLLIEVQEKQTGNFRFGAGFSQLNSLSGFIGIQENNLLGRGKAVSLDWEFGRYRNSFSFQYTEPYFLGTENTLSLSLYNWIQDRVQQQYYTDRRKGFSLSLGRPLPWLDYTRLYGSYRLEQVSLSNFSADYPEFGPLRGIEWPQVKSSVLFSVTRNSTDNPAHPTTGSVNSISAEFCGGLLLGNVDYMRYMVESSWFRTIFWKFVFHLDMNAGVIDGYTSPSQIQDYEKFRLGGNRRYALRGYDFYEVVPEGNDVYVGGRFMTTFSHEILFPFTEAVYGLLFFDAGNTWNSFGEADLFNLRRSIGLGVRLEIPGMGNLGFDYGYGFDKVGGPGWEPHFTFGTMF